MIRLFRNIFGGLFFLFLSIKDFRGKDLWIKKEYLQCSGRKKWQRRNAYLEFVFFIYFLSSRWVGLGTVPDWFIIIYYSGLLLTGFLYGLNGRMLVKEKEQTEKDKEMSEK